MDNCVVYIYRNNYPKCGCSGSSVVSSEQIMFQKLNTIQKLRILVFWTLSIVWYSKEHNILETGSVSILR
jgi:hypothetical protein